LKGHEGRPILGYPYRVYKNSMKIRIRIQGLIVFIVLLMVLIFFKTLYPYWRNEFWDEAFDTLGIVLVLFGFLFRIASRGYKAEKSQGGRILVKDGPYALIRHPMYFGTFLIGCGIISLLFSTWAVFLFIFIYIVIYLPVIKKEEKLLLSRFGEEYIAYRQTVSAYFPKILSVKNKNFIFRLKWVRKEFFSLVITLILIFGIEIAEDVRLFGKGEIFDEFIEMSIVCLVFIICIYLFLRKRRFI